MARYDAIGGISPLAARTEAQRAAIEVALQSILGDDGVIVALGQKHAAPFIEDGVASLCARGVRHIVGVVLAPHYSGFSVGQYHAVDRAAVVGGDVTRACAVVCGDAARQTVAGSTRGGDASDSRWPPGFHRQPSIAQPVGTR